MVESDRRAADDLVVIARVARVRGLRGEVVADVLTDFPERFENVEGLVAVTQGGARRAIELESFWFQRDRVVLKFAGVDTVEAAQELIGLQLAVPEEESVELEDDEFYHWQLEDCLVETVSGFEIGRVREVLETGGVPILMIEDAAGREHLVPLAADICVEIDVERKRVRIDPPEGLLEI